MSFPRDAYPYTNFHELNLGYFIVHFREIFSQWADLYDQMTDWKDATDEELATWKAGVEADLNQREEALRAELETWKAQTGQDIAGWEDATLAALTAWQTATQAVFEAIRVEAAGSATAAAASATDAATAKTAAETAQAAAEAAAASVTASAAQIATNTADISDLKTQLNTVQIGRYELNSVIQGSFNSAGAVVANENRIRNEGFIQVYKGQAIHFIPGTTTAQMLYGTFTTGKVYVNDSAWFTTESTIIIPNDGYIIVVFAKSDKNTAIIPSDFDATFEIVTEWKVSNYELNEQLNDTDRVVNKIAEGLYTDIEINPSATVAGWRLNESDGLSSSDDNYKMQKFSVSTGDYVKIVSDDRWQFQNAASVPLNPPSNKIGVTHGAGVFYEVIPAGVTYIIMSTPTSNSAAKVYSAVEIENEFEVSAFNLFPAQSIDDVNYDENTPVIISYIGKDVTVSSLKISMKLTGLKGTSNTGTFIRFYREDGTSDSKTYAACGFLADTEYNGTYTITFSNVTFSQIAIFPYSDSYNFFSSGVLSDFVVYENNGVYNKILNKIGEPLDESKISGFGIYPSQGIEGVAYNKNERFLIADLGKDIDFDAVKIRMKMNNVVATSANGTLFRFFKADGTYESKTFVGCGFAADKTYTGIYDVEFKNIEFKEAYIYPFDNSYNFFTSGYFSDFVLYTSGGIYDDIINNIVQPTSSISESIDIGLNKIAYEYGFRDKFSVLTDIHQNYKAYKYSEDIVKNRLISTFLMLGDVNNTSETALSTTKTEILKTAKALTNIDLYNKLLPIKGNHDGVLNDSTYTDEMYTSALIKPFVYDTSDIGNYYYDDENTKIRFIMLNSSNDDYGRKGFDNSTITFLTNSLQNVPNGYSIVTATHHPIINVESADLPTNASEVVDIITTYKTNNPDTYICHCNGHMHADKIEKINGVTYVWTTASNGISSTIALDVFCVDKTNKKVDIIRIGDAGTDRSFEY
ncbi:MAG: metallophosphoesterase [Clostridiales bacterium]|nr:metallophosphoesterase [Clostridiales bacterium]